MDLLKVLVLASHMDFCSVLGRYFFGMLAYLLGTKRQMVGKLSQQLSMSSLVDCKSICISMFIYIDIHVSMICLKEIFGDLYLFIVLLVRLLQILQALLKVVLL